MTLSHIQKALGSAKWAGAMLILSLAMGRSHGKQQNSTEIKRKKLVEAICRVKETIKTLTEGISHKDTHKEQKSREIMGATTRLPLKQLKCEREKHMAAVIEKLMDSFGKERNTHVPFQIVFKM